MELVVGTSVVRALEVRMDSELPLQRSCVEMKPALALTLGSA